MVTIRHYIALLYEGYELWQYWRETGILTYHLYVRIYMVWFAWTIFKIDDYDCLCLHTYTYTDTIQWYVITNNFRSVSLLPLKWHFSLTKYWKVIFHKRIFDCCQYQANCIFESKPTTYSDMMSMMFTKPLPGGTLTRKASKEAISLVN